MKSIVAIVKKREAVLGLIIVVLSLYVSSQAPSFFTYENMVNVLKASSVTGIFALGVLIVIISGGIDVSFVAIAQATQYFTVWVLLKHITGGNLIITFLIAVVMGAALGFFNGYLIDHFKMPAIIITISTQNLFYGIMYVVTRGKLLYEIPAYIRPLADTKLFVQTAANGATYGISTVTILWLVLAILVSFFLKVSITGRTIYWVGGNTLAAERVGINIKRTTLLVWTLAGAIAGIASIAHVAVVQTVIPNSIVGTELPVIAVVILGGASIKGGKGSVSGTILGVLLFAIVSNSLTLLQISSYWYNVFTGFIIVVSIVLNAVQDLQQKKRMIRVKVDEREGDVA